MTQEEADNGENKWTQWLASEQGRNTLYSLKKYNVPDPYAANILWWAFHAGHWPINGKLPDEGLEILKEVKRGYVSIKLRRRIDDFLKKQNRNNE